MLSDIAFTKDTLDLYLKELAKEFRKRNGKNTPAEVILIGGAAVVINYGFREMTYDMDAVINASSSMKEAINFVGDKFGLPNGWMNDDFKNTASYTDRIARFSTYYRTFSNVVTFRTVTAEYLVAMKMRSGREYKYDRSDIIGVLWDQEKRGEPLTLERIKQAVVDLYDSYAVIADDVKQFVEQAVKNGNYSELYTRVRQMEIENKENLIEYQEEKPGVVSNDNLSDVLAALRKRKEQK
ncbi:hypothetical protein SAMN02910317_01332 [Ruminococcaceae bacterium FB2012]|nr:hypothetical protein SAMN02910317_01332 [Ruminococcaceae bacterium FB2012]